jgi:chromosome segregation ATPase
LQAQLKSLTADRDRQAFEKSEIIERANSISRERDDFRQRLEAATAERASLASERDRLVNEAAAASRALADATKRAEEAGAEVARLRGALEAGPNADPLLLLWEVVSQKTKAGVAFLRSKIPENHPALPWFDTIVETATRLGCLAVNASVAFAKWAVPQVKVLSAKLLSEVEARLAKK